MVSFWILLFTLTDALPICSGVIFPGAAGTNVVNGHSSDVQFSPERDIAQGRLTDVFNKFGRQLDGPAPLLASCQQGSFGSSPILARHNGMNRTWADLKGIGKKYLRLPGNMTSTDAQNIGLGQFGGVTPFAMGCSILRYSILKIDQCIAWEKMLPTNARGIVANVKNIDVFWNWAANLERVRESVRAHILVLVVRIKSAVTLCIRAAGPDVTRHKLWSNDRAVLVDLRPEAIFYRASRTTAVASATFAAIHRCPRAAWWHGECLPAFQARAGYWHVGLPPC
jgi:hypothetical protein